MGLFRKLLSILLIALLLCGCSTSKQYTAYTVYPIGYILNRIGGNRINSVSIQNNNMIQMARLTPEAADVIDDSIVLFHIGGLEPYMDLYDQDIEETGVDVVDLSVLNALYKFKRYTPVYVNKNLTFVEDYYYDGEIFEEIDTYDLDPYIWLSPIGMLSMAKDVNEYLCSNYVEQSEFFNERYEKLADELIALDASYNALSLQLISSNESIKFVSMSASFGCWQKDYGFQTYPICLSKYGALPSDAQLAQIKQRIKDDGVKYIAYEPNMSDEMSQLFSELEEELELKRVTLNNISSLTSSQIESSKDYMSLMLENLSILRNMATSNVVEEVSQAEEE